MVALVYETIQYSPYVWDGDPELLRQIAAAADAGFAGVGIDRWSIARHLEGGGRVAELADALERHGIRCSELQAFIPGVPDATAADAEELVPLVDALRPDILMSGFPKLPDAAGLDAFRRAAERLTAHGAVIALEFLPMLELRDIAGTRDLVHRLDGPVGVCLDTWHFSHGPDGWDDLAALPVDELAHVQFDDALAPVSDDLWHETLHRRALPGEGVLDVERFCDEIRAKGYAGAVGVEVISADLRALPPEEFARAAFTAAAPFWA